MNRNLLKPLSTLALLAAALVSVVLVRTVLHQPRQPPADALPPLEIDELAVARRLGEAVRFQTVSNERGEALASKEFTAFLDWLAATYPRAHAAMTVERVAGYSLLLEWKGSDPSLEPVLLTGHYDVVPIAPGSEGAWTHPPFSGELADGAVWGRGTTDDKGAVIAQMEAVTSLLERGVAPARTIYFSFGHDEEVGGERGAANVVRRFKERGVQLAWSLDEGSFVFDGMFPGVDPLLAVVNVAEKGFLTLEIVARSTGGHSSMPPRETAVGLLAEAVERLVANPLPGGLEGLAAELFDTASRHMGLARRIPFANLWLFRGPVEARLGELPFGNALLRTTTAPTMLAAGNKANVLPPEAVATVNFRIHPRDSVEGVLAHVRALLPEDAYEVRVPEGPVREPSPVSSWESEGFALIARALRETFEGVVVAPGLMVAGSDSRHYGEVARDAYRFNPMIVTADDLTGFHGTNEHLRTDRLAAAVRAYARILELAAQPESR